MLVAAICVVPIGVASQGMRNMPKQTFSIMMSVEPAVAAIAAFIIIDETLTLSQWFAVALVVIATAGSSATQKQLPKQKQIETLS